MTSAAPLPPQQASATIMAQARANCAERLRLKCQDDEAAAFETGQRDDAWAMRHEVSRLIKEMERD